MRRRGRRSIGVAACSCAFVLGVVVGTAGYEVVDGDAPAEHVEPVVLGATQDRGDAPQRPVVAPPTSTGPVATTTPAAVRPAAVIASWPPPSAAAPVPVPSAGPAGTVPGSVEDVRVDASLALVDFDWVDVLRGWTLAFEGPRPGFQGNTYLDERRIEIYVRPSSTVPQLAQVIAHEIGHAVDVSYLTDVERAEFHLLRGRDADSVWWVESGRTDFSVGAGDWAESFAWWVTGGVGPWGSRLGDPPDAAQQLVIGRLVAAATRRPMQP